MKFEVSRLGKYNIKYAYNRDNYKLDFVEENYYNYYKRINITLIAALKQNCNCQD